MPDDLTSLIDVEALETEALEHLRSAYHLTVEIEARRLARQREGSAARPAQMARKARSSVERALEAVDEYWSLASTPANGLADRS